MPIASAPKNEEGFSKKKAAPKKKALPAKRVRAVRDTEPVEPVAQSYIIRSKESGATLLREPADDVWQVVVLGGAGPNQIQLSRRIYGYWESVQFAKDALDMFDKAIVNLRRFEKQVTVAFGQLHAMADEMGPVAHEVPGMRQDEGPVADVLPFTSV